MTRRRPKQKKDATMEADGHKAGADVITLSRADHEQLQAAATEAATLLDQHQRLAAEYDNARKRLERDKAEFSQWAAEDVLRGLLPIMDSFDRALESVATLSQDSPVAAGIRLIHRQLVQLLERQGVERIQTIGEPFDPHRHEAVLRVESQDQPEDSIVEEVQSGYVLHGRVLRPAMVKIAQSP